VEVINKREGPLRSLQARVKAALQKKLLKNAVYNSGAFLLISIVNFVTLPFFVSKLGVMQYGIFTLITSLFGYYGIFDLGLGQGLIKFVSERIGLHKEKEIISGIVSAFWIQVIIALFVSAALFVFSWNISGILNVGEHNMQLSSLLVKVASVGFFFSMISSIFSSVLMGMQHYHITSRLDGINNIALNVVSLIFLYTIPGFGLLQLLIFNVAAAIVQAVIYYQQVKRNLASLRLYWELNWPLLQQFFKFSVHIFLSKISNVFSTYIVRFIIGFYAGPAAVTYYTVPSKLMGALGGVLSSAANTLMPYISSLKADSQSERIIQAFRKVSFTFSAFTIPVSLFVACYAHEILDVWMGHEFSSRSWHVLTIICISATIGSFSTVPNQVVIGMGNSKLLGFFSLLTVIAYSILLPVLTKQYLLTGASVGLLTASILLIGVVIRKTTKAIGMPTGYYLKKVFAPHIIPVVIFSGVSYAVVTMGNIPLPVKLGVGILLMLGYYVFIFIQHKQEFLELVKIKQ
jgi:O-antigen/teichoic acid export membrane protein